MLAAASSSSTWLRARRSRWLFLVLCSPVLIPFFCVTLPLLCAAEVCLRLCRLRRRKLAQDDEAEEEHLRRCEEGHGGDDEQDEERRDEMGLLQRYLEDQLLLVGSVYDCGNDDDEDLYQEIQHFHPHNDSNTPLLA